MVSKQFIIGIFLLFVGFSYTLAQESYNRLLFEGNKSFNKKDYDVSSSKFSEAAKIKQSDFAAHYNLGNAYYKNNKFEEAKSEYQKAQKFAKNKEDKVAATYNLGNAYMKTNQPEKAAEFYKQSLKQDPYNEKIKKNFEIAKLKDKEKQDQQNQNSKSKDNSGKGKDQKQNQDDKEGKQPQNSNNGQNPSQDQENGGQNQQPKNDDKMPKDLQDAILNRVSNKEKETARRILNKNSYSMPESNEKDW